MYSLVALTAVSLTCTVISVDDGLLRTSTGCTAPSSSPTLYIALLNDTVGATTKRTIISITLYTSVHLQSSSNIVAVRVALDDSVTLLVSEDVSMVRLNVSLDSNILSSFITTLNEAVVCPTVNVTLYGPDS